LKILVVHNFYQLAGGEDAVALSEVNLLKEHGHEVDFYYVHNDAIKSLRQRLLASLGVIYNWRAKKRLRKHLDHTHPDIVHVHNIFPLLSPSVFDACRDAGIPSVLTLHNFRLLCPTALLFHDGKIVERSLHGSSLWAVWRRVYHHSFIGTAVVALMVDSHKWRGTWKSRVDRYIALTAFAKNKFVAGGVPRELIEVKANTLGQDRQYSEELVREGGLYVGRLSAEKGVGILIDAWKDLNTQLRMVGDGPLRMLDGQGEQQVTWIGGLPPDGVQREMSTAAFLIVPSIWYEMFPLVVIEAFASGLPVIVSAHAALKEIVEDGVTGLHFNPGDSADLADKVRWASSHRDEMLQMGRNARRLYEEKYTPAVGYQSLIRIYEKTIAEYGV